MLCVNGGVAGDDALIVVDQASVRETSDFLRMLAESLINGVAEIDGQMRSVLAGWHGPAAEVFKKGWDTTHRGAREVVGSLDEAARLLGVNAAEFEGMDSAISDDARAVGSSLTL